MAMGAPSKSESRMVLSEINVTPLVDVMLVLLVIFMVTAPMMQQGIEIDLPETSSSGVAPSDEPFILVVKRSGQILAGEANIPLPQLATKIKAIFETRKNKQLYLQADRKVEYGVVAQVMAEIRTAGIYNIGLVTVPREAP